MAENVSEKVLDILEDICGDDIVKEEKDINLLEEGLIDSLDYTEILVMIEEEFGIVMSPSEYTREEMDTPSKIINQVKKKLN